MHLLDLWVGTSGGQVTATKEISPVGFRCCGMAFLALGLAKGSVNIIHSNVLTQQSKNVQSGSEVGNKCLLRRSMIAGDSLSSRSATFCFPRPQSSDLVRLQNLHHGCGIFQSFSVHICVSSQFPIFQRKFRNLCDLNLGSSTSCIDNHVMEACFSET